MTYGELITRLCQLRDELKKTPEGREALQEVIWDIEEGRYTGGAVCD